MVSIKQKFILFFIFASLIPLVLVGGYNFMVKVNQAENEIERHLSTLAKIKQQTLNNFLLDIQLQLKALSNNKNVIELLRLSANSEGNISQTPAFQNANEVLLNYQESYWGKLHHVFITNAEGKVIVSPPHENSTSSHLEQNISQSSFFQQSLKKPTITDFYSFSEKDHFHQLSMQPVFDVTGEVLGVIVAEVMIAYQNQILAENFQIGETGKIFITALNGQKIVQDKEQQEFLLEREGFNKVVVQGTVMGNYEDESGNEFFGLYNHDPKYPWILCIEVDRAEILFPIYRQERVTALIFGGIIILGFFLVVLFTKSIQGTLHSIESMVVDIADVAKQVSLSSQTQNASVEEISSSLQELVTSIKNVANNANNVSDAAHQSTEQVKLGEQAVRQANASILRIRDSSNEVADIIDVISEIAEQTNLLALNAAIEAARAGDQGKGFAVVADEVRKLAERSAKATDDITKLIKESQSRVIEGTQLSEKTAKALESIVTNVNNTAELVEQISASTQEQAAVSSLIKDGMTQISSTIEENAAASEELSSSSQKMMDRIHIIITGSLHNLIKKSTRSASVDYEVPSPTYSENIPKKHSEPLVVNKLSSSSGSKSSSAKNRDYLDW
ncbi:methyl-accepting chemotaxis protein [Deltaproteobacteria bacterium TL4]